MIQLVRESSDMLRFLWGLYSVGNNNTEKRLVTNIACLVRERENDEVAFVSRLHLLDTLCLGVVPSSWRRS